MTHIDMDDDEVSLKEFKSQLNKFRSFLRQVLLGIIVLLKRYTVLILLVAVAFTALGFYQYKFLRSYTSRASFTYIESQKKFYGEMADKLQDLIKTGSYKQVAKSLNLPLSQ